MWIEFKRLFFLAICGLVIEAVDYRGNFNEMDSTKNG